MVLDETGRRVLFLCARARGGHGRRIRRRAPATSEQRAGAKKQRCEDPGHLFHGWHWLSLVTLTFRSSKHHACLVWALPVLAEALLVAHGDAHGVAQSLGQLVDG